MSPTCSIAFGILPTVIIERESYFEDGNWLCETLEIARTH